jgi:hypothetical protein
MNNAKLVDTTERAIDRSTDRPIDRSSNLPHVAVAVAAAAAASDQTDATDCDTTQPTQEDRLQQQAINLSSHGLNFGVRLLYARRCFLSYTLLLVPLRCKPVLGFFPLSF